MGEALYRKFNDRSQNSSTYHKKDGTAVHTILKGEAKKEIWEEGVEEMEDKEFLLHWYNRKKVDNEMIPVLETIYGTSIIDAFTKAGYGPGALRALDYYEEITAEQDKE